MKVGADHSATLGKLTPEEARRRLARQGLGLRIGPLDVNFRSDVPEVCEGLRLLYADHLLADAPRVYSCHASLMRCRRLFPGSARKVRFSVDGLAPHEDMPAYQSLAVLEWGLNLAIAMRFHGYFMLHAAVLERRGGALLLPAGPGHGKTTLCAALAHRGWRFFSDEFGLVKPSARLLLPIPRPMPLKNESIGVIKKLVPDAIVGPSIPGTKKGTVAHLKPPIESVERASEFAAPAWIVFPRWVRNARLEVTEVSKVEAFHRLVTNAFNYELLGEAAFEAACHVVSVSNCHRLVYSDLDEAVASLTDMADGHGA